FQAGHGQGLEAEGGLVKVGGLFGVSHIEFDVVGAHDGHEILIGILLLFAECRAFHRSHYFNWHINIVASTTKLCIFKVWQGAARVKICIFVQGPMGWGRGTFRMPLFLFRKKKTICSIESIKSREWACTWTWC